MSAPLFSVLVPVFNQAQFLVKTIRSLLVQDDPDFEVVVVDDGSTDDSQRVLAKLTHPRLKVLVRENGGTSAALNTAFSACSGDYISLIGGDDLAFPDRLARQRALLNAGADLVFSEPMLIDDDDGRMPNWRVTMFDSPVADRIGMLRRFYLQGNYICAPSVAIRRSVMQAIGPFNPALLQLQDYDYWIRCARGGFEFVFSPEPLVRYRVRREGNLSMRPEFQVRARREQSYLLRRFFDGMTSADLCALFPDHTQFRDLDSGDVREVVVALIHLSHPSPEINEWGYDRLIEVVGSGKSGERMFRDFGLSPRVLHDLLVR